ncbi:hypothetical protein CRP01_20105 [Flavilitoribacter nigricans DSM 23189 = NBRC 102662]|uniref:Uncharacterized protein n=1 Tax=Flavilitoribacter nigricans (strain ATCC 23147 / DSM 23189 / NBRC 102662 / NCIMB 1420 / SS-2) TaxID=1122177 RepID=A0A2D0N8V0_FLAN2|nr:hypothetical protein CRP01_20105 [Flavilitoribacter nigricans DSM 23189 = NBRC 102662]
MQRAYANSIKAKAILLPLPKFDARPNFERAHRFFKFEEQGKHFRSRIERIQHLFDEHEEFGLGSTDQDEYIDYYIQLHFQLDKDRHEDTAEDAEINLDSLLALLQVRQWETGKAPRNSPVKLVAGTLVEIGIDYFNQVPGALNPKSSLGQVMQHFLSALDDIEIAESEDFGALSAQIVPQLFIATAESVQTLSKEISSDEKIQSFIAATSKQIADDLIRRARDHGPGESAEAVRWGQLVLRSMVKNAGHYVFNAPADFFRTNAGASGLIQATGTVLLDAILSDPDKLDLKNGFNSETLDRVVRSALHVVSEHPKMISGKDGIREVVVGVSAAMAEAGIKNRPDLLPELVRIILEHTAGNFHLIVRGGPGEPGKHLLVIAVQQLLLAVSRPVPEGNWKLRLPKGQLIGIAENILDEVVMNPDWVLATVADRTLLRETLDATFQALSGLPKDQRLNKEVLDLIIRINIRTVVTNQGVLDRVHWGSDEQEVIILQKGLDLVFHFVFVSGTVAPAERIHLLSELLRYISKVILTHHPDERGLLLIDMILFQDPNVDYSAGFNPKLADDLINAALTVMQTHPELVTGQVSLQNILSGVAGALHATSFKKAGILSELARLSLLYTAENIHLVILADEEEPKYLLVLALRQLLSTLTVREEAEHWQPRLTAAQLLTITENVFDQIVHYPQWLLPDDAGDTVFGAVLEATFSALRTLPKTERLQAKTLEHVVQLSLTTVVSHPQLLDKVSWGTEEEEAAILQHAMNLVVSFVFESSEAIGGDRLQLLVDLLHYILEVVMRQHPGKKGLLFIDLILFEDPDVDFRQGFRPELADQLFQATLKVLDYRPDLITNDQALQRIIEGCAGALKETDLRRKGLLLEVIRLVLESTADNLLLIIKTDSDEAEYLLVRALRELLFALTRDVEDGHWRPKLTVDEVLTIVEDLFDVLLDHPEWVTPDEGGTTLFGEVTRTCMDALKVLPKDQRLNAATLSDLLRLSLRTVAASPRLLQKIHWGTDAEEAVILDHALKLTVAFVFERSGTTGGQRLLLLTELLHYVLEMQMSRYPNQKGLLLLDLILFEDPGVDYSQGFQPELYERLIEAAIRVLDYRPDLVTDDRLFQHLIEAVMGTLKASGYQQPGLLMELVRLVLACTAENVQLIIRTEAGEVKYLLAIALESLLEELSAPPESSDQWHPQLNLAQLLSTVEDVLDYLVIHPDLLTDQLREGTIFAETLKALFRGLRQLPKSQRLNPDSLEWLLRTCLQAAAGSQEILQKIKWGPDEEEAVILEKALELVFAYVFPEEGPARAEALEDLLEYTLEFIIRHHQDKKALLLLYLILFEWPELGRRPLPPDQQVEALVEAGLQLLQARPELITNDAIWQKIIQDTAKALSDSKLDMPELLPEMLRLTLVHTAENIDLLTDVKPNSRQYVLTVAMEQCLRAIAQKPKRGKWKPQLSRPQILEILTLCLETMLQNPLWTKDKLLQLTLEAIFEGLQAVPEERKWAYASIRLLIEHGLTAVSFRKNLVIEVVHRQGRRQVIALTYALEGLLVTLYNEDDSAATASWTLTQTKVLDEILDSFLQGLVEGPITKEAINDALEPVREAMEDLAENAAFSLEELLGELEQ